MSYGLGFQGSGFRVLGHESITCLGIAPMNPLLKASLAMWGWDQQCVLNPNPCSMGQPFPANFRIYLDLVSLTDVSMFLRVILFARRMFIVVVLFFVFPVDEPET